MPQTMNARQDAWLLGLSASISINWLLPKRMAASAAENDPETNRARKNIPATAATDDAGLTINAQ